MLDDERDQAVSAGLVWAGDGDWGLGGDAEADGERRVYSDCIAGDGCYDEVNLYILRQPLYGRGEGCWRPWRLGVASGR